MAPGQRPPEPAELDAVTIDGYGTLVELRNPLDALARLLPGFERGAIARAFRAEAAYYEVNAYRGRDDATVARLHEDCVGVFNRDLGSALTAEQYVAVFEYAWVDGAREAFGRIRARGLDVAVVADWDVTLVPLLDPLHVRVVTSAAAGASKPDPRPFRLALSELRVDASRALHVGDREKDERGAVAAGMRFAWAPLARVVDGWT